MKMEVTEKEAMYTLRERAKTSPTANYLLMGFICVAIVGVVLLAVGAWQQDEALNTSTFIDGTGNKIEVSSSYYVESAKLNDTELTQIIVNTENEDDFDLKGAGLATLLLSLALAGIAFIVQWQYCKSYALTEYTKLVKENVLEK